MTADAATAEPGTTKQAEYTERLERKLEALREDFLALELEQMRKGEIEARAQLQTAKKAIEEKRALVEDKLDRARKVSANAWDEAREGLESAWGELRGAFDRARAEFQGGVAEDAGETENA